MTVVTKHSWTSLLFITLWIFFVIENREWIHLMCPSGQCWSKNCIKKILIVKWILQSPINSCSQPASQELFTGCPVHASQDLHHWKWESLWHEGRWCWSTDNSHDIAIFDLDELRNPGSIITLLSNQYYTFPPWISDFPQALARSKDVSDVLFTCTFSMPGGLIQPMKNRCFVLFILSQSFKPQGPWNKSILNSLTWAFQQNKRNFRDQTKH